LRIRRIASSGASVRALTQSGDPDLARHVGNAVVKNDSCGRMADGGDVVVLETSAPMQIIDVRDLGAFLLRCAATSVIGAFDAVGPFASTASMLTEITPSGATADLVEIDAATLSAAGIRLPMMDADPATRSSLVVRESRSSCRPHDPHRRRDCRSDPAVG
jgi:hypothetical protein